MGHAITVIGIIVRNPLLHVGIVPIFAKIIGGIRFSPADKRTVLDHSVKHLLYIKEHLDSKMVVVADALYCVGPFVKCLLENGIHTISRIRGNGVAYLPFDMNDYKGRGRRPLYGACLHLKRLFKQMNNFTTAISPIPGENIEVKYLELELLPKWLGVLAKYVLVSHPKRGNIVLFATNLELSWDEVYLSYYYRFQIECAFKSLIYDVGAFCYRFWCKSMPKTKIGDKERYVHRETEDTVASMKKTLLAYEIFMALAMVGFGIQQCLSLYKPDEVWRSFDGWIRTIRPNSAPSIKTVSSALRGKLFEFLNSKFIPLEIAKFYDSKQRKSPDFYENSA